MKIIFLDIDGVLNSIDSMIAYHDWLPKGLKKQMEDRLDPISIGLVRKLCNKTDAKIVISSVWRMNRESKDFLDIFNRHGWENFPYYGKTPIIHSEDRRGGEIKHWLDAHPEVSEYIIIDDDSDMLESQMGRFVHVSNINGFRSKHYCQCLRLFGQPDERLESQVNWVKNEKTIV